MSIDELELNISTKEEDITSTNGTIKGLEEVFDTRGGVASAPKYVEYLNMILIISR